MLACLALFVVAMVGGVLPLYLSWSDRQLHAALALSTGIFLGAVFLHLLPSVGSAAPADAHTPMRATLGVVAAAADDPGADRPLDRARELDPGTDPLDGWRGRLVWLAMLAGVLGVYLLEAVVFAPHMHDDAQHHRAVGVAALVGLSIHSLTMGLGYASVVTQGGLGTPVIVALLAHKGFEAFSLSSVFRLAESRRSRLLLMLVAFALVTPAGVLIGSLFTETLGPFVLAILVALAAGTFLYVCLCELLPEVFHRREHATLNVVCLLGGVALMYGLEVLTQ